jgi:hypothetical protein
LEQTNRSCHFPFLLVPFPVYIYAAISIYIFTKNGTTYMDAAVSNGNGKRKPRRFSLIRLPFPHRANGSLSFLSVCWGRNKTELSVCKRTKLTKRICPSMHMLHTLCICCYLSAIIHYSQFSTYNTLF